MASNPNQHHTYAFTTHCTGGRGGCEFIVEPGYDRLREREDNGLVINGVGGHSRSSRASSRKNLIGVVHAAAAFKETHASVVESANRRFERLAPCIGAITAIETGLAPVPAVHPAEQAFDAAAERGAVAAEQLAAAPVQAPLVRS